MSHFKSQDGFSLIELLISVGIFAVVAAVASAILVNYDKAARAHDTNESVGIEREELTSAMQRYWDVRTRPTGYSGSYTSTNKGFTLLDAMNNPCTSGCPQLVMNVTRVNGPDQITVLSQCIDPGAVTGLARLQALNFSGVTAPTCDACPSGQIPIITVTSTLNPADNRRFPHNGATSAATYRMNGILGMLVCFDQAGTGPLGLDMSTFALDPHSATDQLKTFQRSAVMPFDNFANVRLEANP